MVTDISQLSYLIRHMLITFLFLSVNVSSFASAGPLELYPVEPFDFVYPDTTFKGPPITEIELIMARNEYEPFTFAILPDRDFIDSNVTIDIVEPQNAKGDKIGRKNIDIRVVKAWKQAGTKWWADKEVLVPELLLKDDITPTRDSWKGSTYIPPSFSSSFQTTLKKDQVKQIWVTVKTEADKNSSGRYKGKLNIIYKGKIIESITLNINVVPIILPEPGKTFFIYFLGRVKPGHPAYVNRERYIKQLEDIREHGFNGVTIYERDVQNVKEAINRLKTVGFRKAVSFIGKTISSENVRTIRNVFESNGLEIYFYGVDEPVTDDRLKEHIQTSRLIHKARGKVVTAITKRMDDLLSDKGSKAYKSFSEQIYEPLDWANYNLRDLHSYIDRLTKGTAKKRHNIETYYWQIMQENPTMHRMYAGFYLWKSGLDGIFPYCYQHFHTISPYNGGDKRKLEGRRRESRIHRVANVTYPSKDGPVPTLQWEAIREGIDDFRYLKKLRQVSNIGKSQKTFQKIHEILRSFNYVGVHNEGIQVVAPEKFRIARQEIINHILR